MFRVILDDPIKTTEVASAAANSIIKDSVFGGLLIVSVIGIVFLIRRLLAVQDLRVADQVKANELMERMREKTSALMEQFTKATDGVNSAMERLTDVQSDHAKALSDLRSTLANLQGTMDSVIREAVRGHIPVTTSRREPSRPGAYSDVEASNEDRGRR